MVGIVAPHGTVTFLFTDVEASTRLWDQFPEPMRVALAAHDKILRSVIEAHGGYVFSTGGDAFAAAFFTPDGAVGAAIEAQRRLAAERWPAPAVLRVRMGAHTGTAEEREGDYFGPAVNRAARLMAAGHGGQVLVSLATEELIRDQIGAGAGLIDLGEHVLAGFTRPERIFQVYAPGLADRFPALRAPRLERGNLPTPATGLVGHGDDLERLVGELPVRRILTLTGVGGVGKTRLALEAGRLAAVEFADGVWWCELAPVSAPEAVAYAVATTLAVRPQEGQALAESVVESLRGRRLLLVMDNCEHVLEAASVLIGQIAESCPTVTVLATSREALRVAGERAWVVPCLDSLASVELFCERAAATDIEFRRPGTMRE